MVNNRSYQLTLTNLSSSASVVRIQDEFDLSPYIRRFFQCNMSLLLKWHWKDYAIGIAMFTFDHFVKSISEMLWCLYSFVHVNQ